VLLKTTFLKALLFKLSQQTGEFPAFCASFSIHSFEAQQLSLSSCFKNVIISEFEAIFAFNYETFYLLKDVFIYFLKISFICLNLK